MNARDARIVRDMLEALDAYWAAVDSEEEVYDEWHAFHTRRKVVEQAIAQAEAEAAALKEDLERVDNAVKALMEGG